MPRCAAHSCLGTRGCLLVRVAAMNAITCKAPGVKPRGTRPAHDEFEARRRRHGRIMERGVRRRRRVRTRMQGLRDIAPHWPRNRRQWSRCRNAQQPSQMRGLDHTRLCRWGQLDLMGGDATKRSDSNDSPPVNSKCTARQASVSGRAGRSLRLVASTTIHVSWPYRCSLTGYIEDQASHVKRRDPLNVSPFRWWSRQCRGGTFGSNPCRSGTCKGFRHALGDLGH